MLAPAVSDELYRTVRNYRFYKLRPLPLRPESASLIVFGTQSAGVQVGPMCLDANSEQSGLLSVPTLALVRDFARQTMKFVCQVSIGPVSHHSLALAVIFSLSPSMIMPIGKIALKPSSRGQYHIKGK
jgi:hypothetical protein